MICHRLTAVRRGRTFLFAVACVAVGSLASGCTDFRQMVGMDAISPDEFAVESRAPLTIPPDFDLRPPQPGAPRPQEATAAERARKVIDAAGPGKPGEQETVGLSAPAAAPALASQEVQQNALASKLLSASDTTAGARLEKRETTTLKGVY